MSCMANVEAHLQALGSAHLLLAVCCALYLTWWSVFFRPRPERPHGLEYGFGVALIVGAAVCGLVSVVLMGRALAELPSTVPAAVLWPCAAVAYLVLAYMSARFLDRPVTTELLLIVAWTALEVAVVGAVAGTGEANLVPVLTAVVVAACVGSLVCYLLYYRLDGWAAFLDGCGPLVAIGVLSVVFSALI